MYINLQEFIEPTSNPDDYKILIHCRPKIKFHLGNIWMLNNLNILLEKGYKLEILIIPFDEGIEHNHTFMIRIKEEIEITKKFYFKYLGDRKNLRILSSYDLLIEKENINKIHEDLVKTARNGLEKDNPIRILLDRRGQEWALPTCKFVAKCIACIQELGPTHIIFGEKHSYIAAAFNEIIKTVAKSDPPKLICVDKYCDLYYKESMDRVESVHSYIEVTDSEEKIFTKLCLVDNDTIEKWIEQSFNCIIKMCPEKYIDEHIKKQIDLIEIHRRYDKVLFLNILVNLLHEIAKDIPYKVEIKQKINDAFSDKNVEWNIKINLSDEKKSLFTKIIKSYFLKTESCRIYIRKMFGDGMSGAYVFELLIFVERLGNEVLFNTGIMKIGRKEEIDKEYNNYYRYLKSNKTFVFVDIEEPSLVEEGWKGILYTDVKRWLGNNPNDYVHSLYTFIEKEWNSLNDTFFDSVKELFNNHLKYTMYAKKLSQMKFRSIAQYYSEVLPSQYIIRVDAIDGNSLVTKQENEKVKEFNNMSITEVKDSVIRAYDKRHLMKIDVRVNDPYVISRCKLTMGESVNIKGTVERTLEDFFKEEFKNIGLNIFEDAILIENIPLCNPYRLIKDVLGNHFDYFTVSPIHGDFHLGNILYSNGKFAIIDYGTIKEEFVTIHDAVVFISNVIVRILPKHFKLNEIEKIIRSIFFSERTVINDEIKSKWIKYSDLLALFQYSNENCIGIIRECSTELVYYSCLFLYVFSMLKFRNLSLVEKKAVILTASLLSKKLNKLQ